MPAKHRVRPGTEERQRLERLVRTGRAHARTIRHAHILLLSDEGEHGPAWTDEKVADALGCGLAMVARLRRRFVGEDLKVCLRTVKERPGRPPKIAGIAEARLVALACSTPPEGRTRWTVRLLADEFVYTPVHGSWLNPVEIEFSVMGRPCLGRRTGTPQVGAGGRGLDSHAQRRRSDCRVEVPG